MSLDRKIRIMSDLLSGVPWREAMTDDEARTFDANEAIDLIPSFYEGL